MSSFCRKHRKNLNIRATAMRKWFCLGPGARIPRNMDEFINSADEYIARLSSHLALLSEMWKLWAWKKVSPYLEKNPTPPHPSLKYGHTHNQIHNNSWIWNPTLALRHTFHISNIEILNTHCKVPEYSGQSLEIVQVNAMWCRRLAMFSPVPTFEVACCRAPLPPPWRQHTSPPPPPSPPVIFTSLLPHLDILFFH